ncbi:hypothetical protein B0H67DRAFT_680824 [Lasiosphaeris hirsuta]|uniref:hydroxymethylglutaryl-CoA lyase n=1 Tax=Lasiosphaeris hirsuta TaxID=260670 RepID=A0AA40B0M7_9PEZI|nr:hypothetical protein B0H67DRAFT_680824 [Lasiosphaeris hirsuta]
MPFAAYVGPRDGLQNEKKNIPLATKIELIERLAKPALEIAVFAAVTESFSHRNLNYSIADSLTRFTLTRFSAVIAAAKDADLRVRAYISVVLGCPFEGPAVDPYQVAALATELLGMGADSISLGGTTGMGIAPRTAEPLTCLRNAGVWVNEDVVMHFHDTYGQALVNTAEASKSAAATPKRAKKPYVKEEFLATVLRNAKKRLPAEELQRKCGHDKNKETGTCEFNELYDDSDDECFGR